jgi:glycerophosphoryl diester phosphodiesterase
MMAGIGQAAGLPDGSMAEILHSTCRDRLRQRRSPLPRILGHRGARLLAPENTLPGFRAAISEGADGVELDVRRTADQVLVCLHDAGLGRTTNGRGPVREHTLAEVRRLDAGGSPRRNGHHGGQESIRVPTLTEALDSLPSSALVDVEVKCRGQGPDGPAQVADLLAATLEGRFDRDRVLVSSFSRKLVAAAVPALEGISVGLISSALVPLGRALRGAELCGCSVLAAQASAYFGPMAKLAAARAVDAGFQLLAWTVDDPETARRLADLGVGVIVSDRPGELRRALDGAPF